MPPHAKMTPAEVEASATRLSTRSERRVQLKPLVPRRALTQEEREQSTKRLYDDSIAHRQQRLAEIEQAANAEVIGYRERQKKLAEAEKEELVHHLYDESIENKERTLLALSEKELSLDVRSTKKMSKSEMSAAVDRLYREGMEHNRNKHIALFEKFVLARYPPSVKRSPEALRASSEKLFSGEGISAA